MPDETPVMSAALMASQARHNAAEARAQFERTAAALAADDRLAEPAKAADLAAARAQRDARLTALQQEELDAASAAFRRIDDMIAQPPTPRPSPDQAFAWTSTMLEGQRELDGLSGPDSEDQALRLYHRWAKMNNPALERAALVVARERGWRRVIAAFADENPRLGGLLREEAKMVAALHDPRHKLARQLAYSRLA